MFFHSKENLEIKKTDPVFRDPLPLAIAYSSEVIIIRVSSAGDPHRYSSAFLNMACPKVCSCVATDMTYNPS